MGKIIWVESDPQKDYQSFRQFRNRGIGASEAPSVIGAGYKSNLELYYEKIGMEDNSFESLATMAGVEHEPIIAKWRCYYGGTPNSIVSNMRNGVITAEVEDIKKSVYDEDYPFLFASPDRLIKTKKIPGKGALECKSTQRAILDMYEDKLVPAHLIQNLIQIHIPSLDYGEIAYFLDNKTFDLVQVYNPMDYLHIFEATREECRLFWEKVKIGRGLYTEMYDAQFKQNHRKANKLLAEIEANEPPVQQTEAYYSYFNKRYRDRRTKVGHGTGSTDLYKTAKRHSDLKRQIEELRKELMTVEISIKTEMKELNEVTFSDKSLGNIRIVKTSDNKTLLYNNVK